jgi:hypothetical protein
MLCVTVLVGLVVAILAWVAVSGPPLRYPRETDLMVDATVSCGPSPTKMRPAYRRPGEVAASLRA